MQAQLHSHKNLYQDFPQPVALTTIVKWKLWVITFLFYCIRRKLYIFYNVWSNYASAGSYFGCKLIEPQRYFGIFPKQGTYFDISQSLYSIIPARKVCASFIDLFYKHNHTFRDSRRGQRQIPWWWPILEWPFVKSPFTNFSIGQFTLEWIITSISEMDDKCVSELRIKRRLNHEVFAKDMLNPMQCAGNSICVHFQDPTKCFICLLMLFHLYRHIHPCWGNLLKQCPKSSLGW